jgi:hypothetical protein
MSDLVETRQASDRLWRDHKRALYAAEVNYDPSWRIPQTEARKLRTLADDLYRARERRARRVIAVTLFGFAAVLAALVAMVISPSRQAAETRQMEVRP